MRYLLPILLFLSVVCFGSGEMYWVPCGTHGKSDINKTSKRPDANKNAKQNSHSHGGGSQMLSLVGADDKNVSVSYLLPDLSTKTAELKDGMLSPKIEMGGYYALTAFFEDANGSNFAVRYLSANGKPVKVSPIELTNKQKNILEIIPNPLPREHDRYTASKEYRFTVVYNGKPLENMETELKIGGNIQKLKTAVNGRLDVSLPNNFSDVTHTNRQSKEFVLSVSKNENGKLLTSSLSAPFYPNPNDWWQSQYLGFGGVALGFLGGLAVYVRTRKKDSK